MILTHRFHNSFFFPSHLHFKDTLFNTWIKSTYYNVNFWPSRLTLSCLVRTTYILRAVHIALFENLLFPPFCILTSLFTTCSALKIIPAYLTYSASSTSDLYRCPIYFSLTEQLVSVFLTSCVFRHCSRTLHVGSHSSHSTFACTFHHLSPSSIPPPFIFTVTWAAMSI